MPKKVFLLHIPKTAGTSLIRRFESVLAPHESASFIDGHSSEHRATLGDKQFLAGHLFFDEASTLPFIDQYVKVVFFREPYKQIASTFRWLDHYSLPAYDEERRAFPDSVQELIDGVASTDFSSADSLARFLDRLGDRGIEAFDNQQVRYIVGSRDSGLPGWPYQRPITTELLGLFESRLEWFDLVGLSEQFEASVERLNAMCQLSLPLNAAMENVSPSQRTIDIDDPRIRSALRDRIAVDLSAFELIVDRYRRGE